MSKVFISYSRKDEKWKNRLMDHLKVAELEGYYEVWHDEDVEVGENWFEQIKEALEEAQVVIMLISARFLISKFIRHEELPRILERRKKHGLPVIPLLIEPCNWKKVKWLASMVLMPGTGKPLSGYNKHQIESHLAQVSEKVCSFIKAAPRPPEGARFHSPDGKSKSQEIVPPYKVLEKFGETDDPPADLRNVKKDAKPETGPAKIKTGAKITVKASRKLLVLAGVFLAAVIIAAGLIIFKGKPEPVTPVTVGDKPSLAIVYFENKSGDRNLDNWREAFSELLTTDLSQSKYLRVLRSDQVYSIFKRLKLLETKRYSTEDLQKVAKKGRVNRILKGSFIKVGDNFVITAMLIDTDSGETISSLSVEAKGEKHIFTKVDELTRKIKVELNFTSAQIAADIDRHVGKITSDSPEAFKYYSEGIKHYHKANYSQSIQFMEKAAAVDKGFAMAYRTLAACWYNLGYISKEREYIQKAFELSDRVSERERYRIQGDFYCMSEKTYDKAIDAFEKLLRLYPNDWIGNNSLGILYASIEEWDKAIERYEVNIQNKVEAVQPYMNAALAYGYKGLYEKAREVLENYLIEFPGHAWIHLNLYVNYISQGKYDFALGEAEKAFSLKPSGDYFLFRACIYEFMDDFIPAEKSYRKLLESKERFFPLWRGKQGLGALYLLQGRFDEAKQQIKQGIELTVKQNKKQAKSWQQLFLAYINLKSGNKEEALKEFNKVWQTEVEVFEYPHLQVSALNGIGLTYIEIKSMERAADTAVGLKGFIREGMNKKRIRFYYHLIGEIELEKNNFSEAIEYFKQAILLLPSQNIDVLWYRPHHALFIDSLALAYFKSGDLDNAQKEYERITSLSWGRYFYGDIYAGAFYKLGQIYRQKGWKGKAIEAYNKFIDLWKGCDPQFRPLVKDVRKQVKELEGIK